MTRLRRLLGFGGAPGVQLTPDLMQLEHGCCSFSQCTGPIENPQERTRWPTNLSIAFYLALRTKNTREYFQRFGGSGLKLRLAWLFCRHAGTDSRPSVQSGLWKLKVNDTGFFKLGGDKRAQRWGFPNHEHKHKLE
jgi:hypothetical protein